MLNSHSSLTGWSVITPVESGQPHTIGSGFFAPVNSKFHHLMVAAGDLIGRATDTKLGNQKEVRQSFYWLSTSRLNPLLTRVITLRQGSFTWKEANHDHHRARNGQPPYK